MNIKEFSDRTGFYPSFELYTVIEAYYMEQSGDKGAFCKAYKENADGLAEKIQQEATTLALNNQSRVIAAANELRTENETLREQAERLIAQLEREQEWKPYGHNSSMKDDDYAHLCQSGRTMTDDEAVELIASEFGFAPEKIEIVRQIKTYEVSRHRQLRQKGTIDRLPVYDATDWNYVRFDCAGWQYEMINGQLHPFND